MYKINIIYTKCKGKIMNNLCKVVQNDLTILNYSYVIVVFMIYTQSRVHFPIQSVSQSIMFVKFHYSLVRIPH